MTAIVAAACSGSGDDPATPPAVDSTPTSATAAPTTTPVSVPPTITTKPVEGAAGPAATLTSVQGDGPATFPVPASVGLPAIAHARYAGDGNFIVTALDATGQQLAVLANSLGSYDGTFPVGFIDQTGNPTAQLRVQTTGLWHLDLGNPALAPELHPPGISGTGDAVLSYTGPKVAARLRFDGTSAFRVDTYSRGRVTILANAVGPYAGNIAVPAGPALVSVTADGNWSITLGKALG